MGLSLSLKSALSWGQHRAMAPQARGRWSPTLLAQGAAVPCPMCASPVVPSPYPQVGSEVVAERGHPYGQHQRLVPGRLVALQQEHPPGQLRLQPVQLQLGIEVWQR